MQLGVPGHWLREKRVNRFLSYTGVAAARAASAIAAGRTDILQLPHASRLHSSSGLVGLFILADKY